MLFCSMYTTRQQIQSFIQRVLYDQNKSQYFCFDLQLLSQANLNFLLEEITRVTKLETTILPEESEDRDQRSLFGIPSGEKKLKRISLNKNLCVFVLDGSAADIIVRDSQIFNYNTIPDIQSGNAAEKKYQNRFRDLIPKNCTIVTSNIAQMGKTYSIEKRAQEKKSKVLTLFIAGDLSPENLKSRLQKLQKEMSLHLDLDLKDCNLTLHIKLDITFGTPEHTACLDQILYQIIFTKCIAVGNGYLFLHNITYFEIEVANTFKDMLREQLSVLKLLTESQPLQTTEFKIPDMTKQSIQIKLLEPHGFYFVGSILYLRQQNQLAESTLELSNKVWLENYKKYSAKLLDCILAAFENPNKDQLICMASYNQLISFIKLLNK